MANILFFPCNGHGVLATLQTMNAISIAVPNLQINTLSTNCDSGGATGNDRIINEKLSNTNSKYQNWKNLALGDYMKLLMGFVKHKFTVEADNKTDIQVRKWIIFEKQFLNSNTRNNNSEQLINQIQGFFEIINPENSLNNLLDAKGVSLETLREYVGDYLLTFSQISSSELKNSSQRGQTVWFYLLVNFLYNICDCNLSDVNSIWQKLGIIYPNINLGIVGDRAHHLSYLDNKGNLYPEEDTFDNRQGDVSLDMKSSNLYNSAISNRVCNNSGLGIDIGAVIKIQQADQIVIPLGSYETVYAYLNEYRQYLDSKKIILIMNSNMTEGQKSEYNQLLKLLSEVNLSELVLIGHPAEINSELKLPPETKIKYVGHDNQGMLRTGILNSEVLKQIITNVEINFNLENDFSVVLESFKEARLSSHLSIFKPYLSHAERSELIKNN